MAYGYTPYYPQYQPPMQDNLSQLRQQFTPPVQQQQSSGILWVQGIDAAKAYMTAPGASVMLMDSESQTFYIKSTDQSGMPLPLRVFDYVERTEQTGGKFSRDNRPAAEYVTRKEFDEFKKSLTGGAEDVEPIV